MKDSDELFDVIGVNLTTCEVRIMARNQTAKNSEAYVAMAVIRRGGEREFFEAAPAGRYRDGDKWEGTTRAQVL